MVGKAKDANNFANIIKTNLVKERVLNLELGKNAIICSADKISILSDGTLLLPVSSI